MKLSSVIITKNEEAMIFDCIQSVKFSDEIIVVDTGNTDQTNSIAKSCGAKVIVSAGQNYAEFRNTGIKSAKGEWLLFVDADERVTPALATEIRGIISDTTNNCSAYLLPRKNNYLGKFMKYGGWGGEKIPRLFKTKCLKKYVNELHEIPIFDGQLCELSESLVHYSHRDISSMVEKTIFFTKFEAKLRIAANHPPIVSWRIFRIMLTEFYNRFIRLSAWRDGSVGVIEGLFQVFNSYIIYSRVWEMQQDHHE